MGSADTGGAMYETGPFRHLSAPLPGMGSWPASADNVSCESRLPVGAGLTVSRDAGSSRGGYFELTTVTV